MPGIFLFKEEDIIAVGLAYRRDNNIVVDRFINRLMFTLKDIKGRVIGFTGRKLDDNLDVAKYINTNENIVYSKGNNLYGLDIAKNYSRNEMIIVEGNMDAISLHQRDIKNVVASMGTALTEKQARLILRYTKNVKINKEVLELIAWRNLRGKSGLHRVREAVNDCWE